MSPFRSWPASKQAGPIDEQCKVMACFETAEAAWTALKLAGWMASKLAGGHQHGGNWTTYLSVPKLAGWT